MYWYVHCDNKYSDCSIAQTGKHTGYASSRPVLCGLGCCIQFALVCDDLGDLCGVKANLTGQVNECFSIWVQSISEVCLQ